MWVGQGRDHRGCIEAPFQQTQGGQGLHPNLRAVVRRNKPTQAGSGTSYVASLNQKSLNRVSLPAIGGIHGRDQPRGIQKARLRDRTPRGPARGDAVDAATVVARSLIHPSLHLRGNPLRMLKDEAVHVGDIQRTVGAHPQGRGPEPVIGAGQEFGTLLAGGPLAVQGAAPGAEHLLMDDVVDRFANEDRVRVGRPEQVIAVRSGTAPTGHMIQRPRLVGPDQGRGGREGPGRIFALGQHLAHPLHRHLRISAEIMLRQGHLPQPGGVVVAEPVTPIIATTAELGLGRDGLHLAGVRIHPQIASANGQGLAGLETFHGPAAIAVGEVKPAVETPFESIEAVLLIALGEAREEHASHIGTPVAIGVFGVEQFGSRRDEGALSEGQHTRGKGQVGEERYHAIHAPIAIVIVENIHPATGFAFAVEAQRVVPHLDHPQPPLHVPVEVNRIDH